MAEAGGGGGGGASSSASSGAGGALGALGLGLTALSMIQGAFASYQQGKILRSQLRLQAEISQLNARVAEGAAQSALARGQRAEQNIKLKTGQLKAQQRVALAANGIDLAGGGIVDNIEDSTTVMGELDALTISQDAALEALNFRTQGINYRAQAGMASAQASGINPGLSAFTSLLGSAGQFATSAYQYQKLNGSGMQPASPATAAKA